MNKKELTRVVNFVEKIKEIDLADVRAVAEAYAALDNVVKTAKVQMDNILKPVLVENKVQEMFPEMETKVMFSEGRDKTAISIPLLSNLISLDDFLSVATVTEKKIKDHFSKETASTLIAETKETTGKTADTIRVSRMTKKELAQS